MGLPSRGSEIATRYGVAQYGLRDRDSSNGVPSGGSEIVTRYGVAQ